MVIFAISHFGFEGGTLVLIASVPGHCLLAHLSRRLIGELIVYGGIRRPSSVLRLSTYLNDFSTKTVGRFFPYFIYSIYR